MSKLAIFSSGDARRCDIVLIHAFPLDHRLWRHVLDNPPDGARVIAPDLPGFGSTSLDIVGDNAGYDLDALAELIADTVRNHGVERAIFAGCSMGGYVCFSMLRNHPEMVSGLLLSDTRATADTPDAREGRVQLIGLVKAKGISAVADSMPGRLLGETSRRTRPELAEEVRSIILGQDPAGVTSALTAMADRADSSDLLPDIDMPVSVVVGSEDTLVPVEEASAMAASIPGSELSVIDGIGHLPALEDPASFGKVLNRLVDGVCG